MSNEQRSGVSRRSLLKWGLGAAAALPLLRMSRRVHAGGGAAPVRLILWPSLNGADPAWFWPNPGNLSAMSLVTEPLAPFQSQIQFVDGLSIEGSYNHFAVRSMFTGHPIGDYLEPDPTVKSIDQVVADHVEQIAPTYLRSLHLGAIPADSIELYQLFGRSTFFFNPTPVHYEANPVTAFDAVFGGLGAGETPPPETGRDYQADVLGITEAELDGLSAKLGRSPREARKVADHRAAIAGLRGGGGGGAPPLACDASPLPSVEALRPDLEGNPAAAYQHVYFDAIMDAQVDLLARAVVCGLTRVATLQAGSADGNVTVPIDGGYPHRRVATSHGAT
jgi:hypothetical protein